MQRAGANLIREIQKVIPTRRQLEGGGFPVRRPFPMSEVPDPFLLLDEMGPVDWPPNKALGAPPHPHRGFETVTYLLQGNMQHADSAGNSGDLNPGDVQWMTAGSGVIHSELPHPDFLSAGGTSHGFQIWVNLPSKDKMMAPRYQDIPKAEIPVAQSEDGLTWVKVVAGACLGVSAVIDTVQPVHYLHFRMEPGAKHTQDVPESFNGLIYCFAGEVLAGSKGKLLKAGSVGILGSGESIELSVDDDADLDAEFLLLAGLPTNEPIARWGPFVMNTQEEIMRAVDDYEHGRLVRAP